MLPAGFRLGPYAIEALVGQGGMGAVYRARDTRLDRVVAVKVLAEHLSDGEARQRFEREAKTIARLDHPHICAVHDIGRADGVDYLVLEFLSGETLAQRLGRGPLPLNEAMRIAFEIAGALEAAHRQHVVHRDLKPGNVMLTKSGSKLLDFGLAKPLTLFSSAPGASRMETAAPITARGMILGTLRYMAPEQVEGRDTDARTDVFAFGAMLYEMVTGRAAFGGDSQASIIAAILEREPEPMAVRQPSTPTVLAEVVRGCLEKDPDRRWQGIRDVSNALRIVDAASTSTSTTSVVRASSRWRYPSVIAALAVVLAFVAVPATVLWSTRATTIAAASPIRFEIASPPVWSPRLGTPTFAMSADGETIVYIGVDQGVRRLYVRKLGDPASRAVPGTDGAAEAYVAPDGRTAMFVFGGGNGAPSVLRRVSLAGGAPEAVGTGGFGSLRGLSWGEDGTLIVSRGTDSGLWRLAPGSREPVRLTHPDVARGERSHRWPHLLPDGRGVLFTRANSEIVSFDDATISVYQFDTGQIKDLIHGGSYPVYSATGHLLYARGGAVMAVPFDLDRLEVTGSPSVVLNDVLMYPASGGAQYALSKTGILAAMHGGAMQEPSVMTLVDRTGRTTPVPFTTPYYNSFSVSPAGAIAIDIDAANASIWVGDLATATAQRLTLAWSNNNPSWSPDGKRIVFNSQRGGDLNLFWQPVDGSEAEQLTSDQDDQGSASFSPDGRYLVFENRVQGSPTRDIHLMDLQAQRKISPLIATPFDEGSARISPDGRWIAYRSNESGTPEIYTQQFPSLRQKTLVSRGGSLSSGVWSKRGNELFYIRNDGTMMAVGKPPTPEGPFGTPSPLFRWKGGRAMFDTTPSGDFVMVADASNGLRAVPIEVTINWPLLAELKKTIER